MGVRGAGPAPATPGPGLLWRTVALPVEHGGWSLLLEPVILGLVVAPSFAGAWIASSALTAFLARHPLKLAALDRRRGLRYPRTALAERFFAGYAALAALSLAVALSRSSPSILIPFAVAAPLALLALSRDLQGRSREIGPEMAGALALGSSAPAIILAKGGAPMVAWLSWALIALRVVTTILYVRARVRVDRSEGSRNRSALAAPVLMAHAAALLLALGATALDWLPPIGAAAFALLMARAAYGLASARPPIRPQILGIQEVFVGLACICIFAVALASMGRP